MLPDRVSNPGPDLRVRCPTDCATRPGSSKELKSEYVGCFGLTALRDSIAAYSGPSPRVREGDISEK